MKHLILIFACICFTISSTAQDILIEEGRGIGPLKIGQSFEEVVNILGFNGTLKTYEDYVDEELFFVDPDKALECVIGFDYYVKYEHLLKLPISYIYFKDNVINQIKVSSFPEYYFALARDSETSLGLKFWATEQEIEDIYGAPDLSVDYENFILNAMFYFGKGITINARDNNYRTAHIYSVQNDDLIEGFIRQF